MKNKILYIYIYGGRVSWPAINLCEDYCNRDFVILIVDQEFKSFQVPEVSVIGGHQNLMYGRRVNAKSFSYLQASVWEEFWA